MCPQTRSHWYDAMPRPVEYNDYETTKINHCSLPFKLPDENQSAANWVAFSNGIHRENVIIPFILHQLFATTIARFAIRSCFDVYVTCFMCHFSIGSFNKTMIRIGRLRHEQMGRGNEPMNNFHMERLFIIICKRKKLFSIVTYIVWSLQQIITLKSSKYIPRKSN